MLNEIMLLLFNEILIFQIQFWNAIASNLTQKNEIYNSKMPSEWKTRHTMNVMAFINPLMSNAFDSLRAGPVFEISQELLEFFLQIIGFWTWGRIQAFKRF